MVQPILYHFGASTCSQKVRQVFAEKGVAFESRAVNLLAGEQHAPAYVLLNPDHQVPTLVVDGEVLLESTLICEFIDDHYDGPSLRPTDSFERYRGAAIMRFTDTRVHGKVSGVPAHAILTRGMLSSRTDAEIEAYLAAIPDPDERALRTSLVRSGVHAPEMREALIALARFARRVDADLAHGDWLGGGSFGIADAGVLPYLDRFAAIGLGGLWDDANGSRVSDWLARCRARPSYAQAYTEWMPAALAETFAGFAEAIRPELEPMVAAAVRAASE